MRAQRATVLGLVAVLVFACIAPAHAKAKKKATNGEICTIIGTSKSDRINGTSKRDVICGLGGNDVIKGFGGNDVIDGGKGNDKIYGGAGNDIVFASSGNDLVHGNPGNDLLAGGTGKDSVDGGTGNDVCMYDLKDLSRRSCSSTQAGLGSVGISLNISQSGANTIFSGKNSSSTARYLIYDYASFNLKGQSECGGGGDLGWVLPGDSFRFERDNFITSCAEWGTFGSLNVKASSTVTYSLGDLNEIEVKIPAANQPGLQVNLEWSPGGNCLSITAYSETLSGRLGFHMNEYDTQGVLTASGGGMLSVWSDEYSSEPIVVRPGIETSVCIERYRVPGPTLRVVSAYVFPDAT
jgi:hypothetical protein